VKSIDPIPLYRQLKDTLHQQIEQGSFKPDHLIPSERNLCDQYRISRITVRQALSEMINEGILYRKQGKGTFVARPKVNQGLVRIVSFSKTVLDLGMQPSTKVLGSKVLPADIQIAKILDLPVTGQVMKLFLLGMGDGEPLVHYESCFSLSLGRRMAREAVKNEKKGISFSTYDLYGEATGAVPGRVIQTLEAVVADAHHASLMKVKKGTALLTITSVFETRDGRPLEFRRAQYRGDRYKFHITRELP
jgi:GntR family transcriptional regulator